MLRCLSCWPADVDLPGRIALQPAEEAGRGGLTGETGARINLGRPGRTVGEFHRETRADGGGIPGWSPQLDPQGVPAGQALVAKGQHGVVVPGDQEVRPAIVIKIEYNKRLRVPRHEQATLGERHRGKMSVAVAPAGSWLRPPSKRPTTGVGA